MSLLARRHPTASGQADARPSDGLEAEDDPTHSPYFRRGETAVPSSLDENGASADTDTTRGRRRAESRHRRTRSTRLSPSRSAFLRFTLPALIFAVLLTVSAIAFTISPDHRGPLPPMVTLSLLLATVPLVFAASRRLGIGTLGALVAATLASLLLPTASADVAGAPEHIAVVSGLCAVALWPIALSDVRRRYSSGLFAGIAIAASPLALIAVAVAITRLIWRRGRPGARAVLGPTVLGLAVTAALLLAELASPSDIDLLSMLVWNGALGFESVVIGLAPALAIGAGAAAEMFLAAIGRRDNGQRLLGVAGVSLIGIFVVASLGAVSVQIRDRAISAELQSDNGSLIAQVGDDGTPSSTTPPADDESSRARAAEGAQLLQNPRLTTTDTARELLESGAVDRRIMIVLGQILTAHDLTVADFPAIGDEDVRRQLLVTSADGTTLETGGASIPTLSAYLSGLTDEFAVETVAVDSGGVLATFAATE